MYTTTLEGKKIKLGSVPKNYLVSIVMPNYNSCTFIANSIQSVLAQTFTDWELIIVDDDSSDQSCQLIKTFNKKDSRISLIRLAQNQGPAVARNIGINAAKGRYIAFLDSDDLWLPHKLETQLAFMKKNDVAFSYSAYYTIDEFGERLGSIGIPEKLAYKDLLKTCYIGCLTAIYDTSRLGKVEMPLIRKRQDYALWLKLLKKVEYACGINQPLAIYRIRNNSISSNKIDVSAYTWKVYREVESFSLLKSSYYFSHYAVRGFLRKKFPTLAKAFSVLHDIDEVT